jgi:hypothetical protein
MVVVVMQVQPIHLTLQVVEMVKPLLVRETLPQVKMEQEMVVVVFGHQVVVRRQERMVVMVWLLFLMSPQTRQVTQ